MPRFSGPISKECEKFIATKRAMGFKFITEAYIISVFDKYLLRLGALPNCLTKESVIEFASKRESESDKSFSNRASLIRQFGIFMSKLGYDAYILPPFRTVKSSFVPYIYTQVELKRIFKVLDNLTEKFVFGKMRAKIYPVLFRILYGCGLRIGEATRLKVSDVDLISGYIVVRNAKHNSERVVPMSESLRKVCRKYYNEMHSHGQNEYFFPSSDGGFLCSCAIYHQFKAIRKKHGLPLNGRIHDLRHTFAVHSLNKAVKNSEDISAFLPILSKYLGHKNIAGTEKYLRLTAEIYPDITKLFEEHFGDVLPEVLDE